MMPGWRACEVDITGLGTDPDRDVTELLDAIRAVRDDGRRTVLLTEDGRRIASVNPVRGELQWQLHVMAGQLADATRLLEEIRDHTLGGTVTAHDGTVLAVRTATLEAIHVAADEYVRSVRPVLVMRGAGIRTEGS